MVISLIIGILFTSCEEDDPIAAPDSKFYGTWVYSKDNTILTVEKNKFIFDDSASSGSDIAKYTMEHLIWKFITNANSYDDAMLYYFGYAITGIITDNNGSFNSNYAKGKSMEIYLYINIDNKKIIRMGNSSNNFVKQDEPSDP
jgi:hypothetical protein